MNDFDSILQSSFQSIQIKHEVILIVSEIIALVELKCNEYKQNDLIKQLKASQLSGSSLIKVVDHLDKDNQRLNDELQTMVTKTSELRDVFITQIGKKFKEMHKAAYYQSNIADLKQQLEQLQSRNMVLEALVSQHNVAQSQPPPLSSEGDAEAESKEEVISIERESNSESSPSNAYLGIIEKVAAGDATITIPIQIPFDAMTRFVAFKDINMLNIFSYLQTSEVLKYAQTCRLLFRQVNQLFGLGSSLVVRWDSPFGSTPSATPASDLPISPSMIDTLVNGHNYDLNITGPVTPQSKFASTSSRTSQSQGIMGFSPQAYLQSSALSPAAALANAYLTTLMPKSSTSTADSASTSSHSGQLIPPSSLAGALSTLSNAPVEVTEGLVRKLTGPETRAMQGLIETVKAQNMQTKKFQGTINALQTQLEVCIFFTSSAYMCFRLSLTIHIYRHMCTEHRVHTRLSS